MRPSPLLSSTRPSSPYLPPPSAPPRRPRGRAQLIALGIATAAAIMIGAAGVVPANAAEAAASVSPAAAVSSASSTAAAEPAADAPTEQPSTDGLDAVGDLLGDEVPAAAAKLIDDAVPLDGAVAVSDGTLTALPTDDDPTIDSVSLTSGQSVSFAVDGMSNPEQLGDAVVADTGKNSSVMVQASEAGVQIVTVAETAAAASASSFTTDVPDGSSWLPQSDGGLTLVDAAGAPIMVVEAPWAVDANGVKLPTHFTVDGNTITQHVATAGAALPIMADPSVLWWVGTALTCAAEVGALVLGFAGAKLATTIANASRIINETAALKKVVTSIGGLKATLQLLEKAAGSWDAISATTRARLALLASAGLKVLSDALGIGGCYSLVKAMI